MRFRHRAITGLAAGLLLFAACGDDDDAADTGSVQTDTVDDASSDVTTDVGADGEADDDQPSSDAAVVVTVDGQEYPMTIVQTCETERNEDRSQDLAMYGFAESGERVELTFSYQGADTSPTGIDLYFGSVGIASGELSAQTVSEEPFDFLEGDRTTVSGSVTMTTTSGDARDVVVEFDITCS